ncbi:HepT-like ribonuclease domain-containing protein [Microseira wollei]|uniref:Uncharacterized protein n=1 Tax=Microseira wollei NIES-4236 TaxID=2530354 RepID=A0AAV3XEZ6_9CYAN|nr:HepT-like ribonuclease domain-containing protein [Microseira wollei]GET40939.1 protein of unknown function DUF86 [Microseira wollei NIES-4236]
MSRSLRLYLEDILTSGAKVIRYTQGMSFEEFIADERTFDAVVRNLQIIGEAVKNNPRRSYHLCFLVRSLVAKPTIFQRNFGVCVTQILARYTEVEWRKIAG